MMRKMLRKVFSAGLCVMVVFAARSDAQRSEQQARGSLELAVTYNPTLANTVGGYGLSMQGASVQVHGQFFAGGVWRLIYPVCTPPCCLTLWRVWI